MKSQKFLWLLFPIALAISTGVCFTSCNDTVTDELQPDTKVNPATSDDDTSVSPRSCLCSTECPIEIEMVSGNASLTVCGTTDGSASCTSVTTSCGSITYPAEKTVSLSTTGVMCICVPPGRSFRVTNNSGANVTIELTTTGSGGTYPSGNVTIPANSSQDFEATSIADCNGSVTVCP